MKTTMNRNNLEETTKIAGEAYVYAFPMLMGYRLAFASYLMPGIPSCQGPVNALHGKAATFDHTFKDVITPNADGLLTITVQRQQPEDATARANWLLAHDGPFCLVMRIYWPERAALDGSWTPPSVVRIA